MGKGTLFASCGHEVFSGDDLFPVEWDGEDCDAVNGFHPCTFTAMFCRQCADNISATHGGRIVTHLDF